MPATADYLAVHPFAPPDEVNPPEAPLYRYRPDITTLTGAGSLEEYITVGQGVGSRVDILVNNLIQSYVLYAGIPTGSTIEVVPDDYDVITNQVYWLKALPSGDVSVISSGNASAFQTLTSIGLDNSVDPTDGQYLAYSATDDLWELKSIVPGVASSLQTTRIIPISQDADPEDNDLLTFDAALDVWKPGGFKFFSDPDDPTKRAVLDLSDVPTDTLVYIHIAGVSEATTVVPVDDRSGDGLFVSGLDALGNLIFATPSGSGSSFLSNHTARVDPSGSDATGTIGDLGKPFLTIQAALTQAESLGITTDLAIDVGNNFTSENLVTSLDFVAFSGVGGGFVQLFSSLTLTGSGAAQVSLYNSFVGDITATNAPSLLVIGFSSEFGNVTNSHANGTLYVQADAGLNGIGNLTADGAIRVYGATYLGTVSAPGHDIHIINASSIFENDGPVIDSAGSEVWVTNTKIEEVTAAATLHLIDSRVIGTNNASSTVYADVLLLPRYQMSISFDATSGLKLLNDSATPGNSKYYGTDSGGTKGYFALPATGGAVATDAIWDAKGDLVVGTGADTAAKLTAGTNDTILMADSAQTTGLKWGTPSTVRTALGLVIGTNVQAWDADLDSWATKTPYAGSLVITTGKTVTISNTLTLTATDGSTLTIGTGGTLGSAAYTASSAYQPIDSDLTTIAGLTATTDNFIVSVSSAWASRTPAQVRTTLGLVIGTDVQAFDTDLTTWAGITPGTGVATFLATPSFANFNAMTTGDDAAGVATGNNFTVAQTLTLAPAANTATTGWLLTDTTTASSGNQQYSPALRLVGQGWKTTATAASQQVEANIDVRPVQSSTNAVFSMPVNAVINGTTQQVCWFGACLTGHPTFGIFGLDGAAPANILSGAAAFCGFGECNSSNVFGVYINGTNRLSFLSTGDVRNSAYVQSWSATANGGGTVFNTIGDTGLARNAAGKIEINNGTAGTYRDLIVRQHYVDQTVTAGGTTGAQTINKAAGTVNFAAAATSLVVTNSLVSTSSSIYCVIRTNDTTAIIKNVVPASGSFTITLNAAATAETSVGFLVIN